MPWEWICNEGCGRGSKVAKGYPGHLRYSLRILTGILLNVMQRKPEKICNRYVGFLVLVPRPTDDQSGVSCGTQHYLPHVSTSLGAACRLFQWKQRTTLSVYSTSATPEYVMYLSAQLPDIFCVNLVVAASSAKIPYGIRRLIDLPKRRKQLSHISFDRIELSPILSHYI